MHREKTTISMYETIPYPFRVTSGEGGKTVEKPKNAMWQKKERKVRAKENSRFVQCGKCLAKDGNISLKEGRMDSRQEGSREGVGIGKFCFRWAVGARGVRERREWAIRELWRKRSPMKKGGGRLRGRVV